MDASSNSQLSARIAGQDSNGGERTVASAMAVHDVPMLREPEGWPPGLFEACPFGLVVTDRERRVQGVNGRAAELILSDNGRPDWSSSSCCDLICEGLNRQGDPAGNATCLTEQALAAGGAIPETRADIHIGGICRSVWITASVIDREARRVVLYLRPVDPDDRTGLHRAGMELAAAAEINVLRIHTLGRTRVEVAGMELDPAWLDQRPGQLLQYLVCNRHRVVASDQITEALWPDLSPWTSNSLRHQVHVLRDKLEPNRPNGHPSRFIATRRGGYTLDERVWIDADEFEGQIRKGLPLYVKGEGNSAASLLERALTLYEGDFFDDSPYAEWALEERDRLRELVGRALSAVISVRRSEGDLDAAAAHASRLAAMEPYDMDVQRDLLELCLTRGRRSAAIRRYAVLRMRLRRQFGHGPNFALSDLRGWASG